MNCKNVKKEKKKGFYSLNKIRNNENVKDNNDEEKEYSKKKTCIQQKIYFANNMFLIYKKKAR